MNFGANKSEEQVDLATNDIVAPTGYLVRCLERQLSNASGNTEILLVGACTMLLNCWAEGGSDNFLDGEIFEVDAGGLHEKKGEG
jgi:hypothetical protein